MPKVCLNTIKDIVNNWESYEGTIEEFAEYYLTKKQNVSSNSISLWSVFWEAYPRKVGKKAAEKAFFRLSLTKQDKAVSMIQKYKILADMYGTDYLHPSTYLNQERFNDDDLLDIPTGADIRAFVGATKSVFGIATMNELQLIKAAKIIMKHKATAQQAKEVATWMSDVWGSSAEWRPYVNLNSMLNESKWRERVLKAKDYLNGK